MGAGFKLGSDDVPSQSIGEASAPAAKPREFVLKVRNFGYYKSVLQMGYFSFKDIGVILYCFFADHSNPLFFSKDVEKWLLN